VPFDSAMVGACTVICDESTGEWKMFYAGRPDDFGGGDVVPVATGLVGMATSRDGLDWKKVCCAGPMGACFGPSAAVDAWDGVHVAVGDVVPTRSGTLLMYYFGGGSDSRSLGAGKSFRGVAMSIGRAESNDGGLRWQRSGEGEALIAPRDDDQLFVGWPTAVKGIDSSEPTQTLFYHACDLTAGGKFAIARARRRPGPNEAFEADADYVLTAGAPGSFDAGGVSARSVVAHPSAPWRWMMAYEAQSEGERRHTIGLAYSEDEGATWTRVRGGPVLEPMATGAWDDGAVARPCIVLLDTAPKELAAAPADADVDALPWPKARLYYLGRSADGSIQGIGIVESANERWTEWVRV